MINWFNHCYPYSNFHELNLDWVIYTVRKGEADIKNFIGLNTIKYADPILWDITRQYESNTVVVDPTTGSAFISVKPVPYGTHINNTEYWTQIYNYADIVDTLREQIAYNEGLSTTATRAYSVDDLVFTNNLLFKVVAPMIAGDSFVENSNIVKTTINDELLRLADSISDAITTLQGLINDEATARENADTTLQSNIEAEATARENADTTLQANIDAEASARESVDTTLQANIDAEATARENADTTLQANIDAEASTRESADSQLQEYIRNVELLIDDLTPIDVTEHGLIGDGATNECDAFAQLLEDYPNYAYYFPKGTYIFTDGAFKGNINLVGDGDAIIKDFVYENMEFPQTNRQTQYDTNQDFFTAKNLKFENTDGNYSLTMHVQSQGSVLRCFDFRNCVFDGDYGLRLVNCITGNISSCDFIHNIIGIKFESCTNITVAECNWYSPVMGINIGVADDDTAGRAGGESIMLTACQMIDGVTGILAYRHNYLEMVNCMLDYLNMGVFLNGSKFARLVNTYIGYDGGNKSDMHGYIAPPNKACVYGFSDVSNIAFSFEAINSEFTAYGGAPNIPLVLDGTGNTNGEDVDIVACRFTCLSTTINTLLYITSCYDVYVSGNRFYAPRYDNIIAPYVFSNCSRLINSNNDYSNCFNTQNITILPQAENRQTNMTYQECHRTAVTTDGTSPTAEFYVDFDCTYDSPPVVIATTQGGNSWYAIMATVSAVSTTRARIALYNVSGGNIPASTYNVNTIVMLPMY